MNGDVIIRRVKVEDAPSLLSIIPRLDRETDFTIRVPGEFNYSLEEEEEFISSIIEDKKSVLFVAEYKGEIVGSICFRGNNLEKYKHTGESSMGILKKNWGKGIGSMLLEQLINWSDFSQIRKINLKVMESNTRAINLYKKFGFEVEGIIKEEVKIGDDYLDTILMSKQLRFD